MRSVSSPTGAGFLADIWQVGIAAAVIQLTGKRETMEKRLAALGKSDEEMNIARSRYQGYINETLPTIEYLRGVVPKVVPVTSANVYVRGSSMLTKDRSLQTPIRMRGSGVFRK